RRLKTLARKFKLILFVVTHPAKSARDKSIEDMSLSDVAGSYAWDAKADLGLIIHRPYDEMPETYVKVAKSKDSQRYGQRGTIVIMDFVPAEGTYRFTGFYRGQRLNSAPPASGSLGRRGFRA